MINRRNFIGNAGALALLGSAPSAFARPRSCVFGIQLWSVAKLLATDFEATIARLAKLGYRELETYGPYAFSDPRQIASWNAVTPQLGFSGSGFFGHDAKSVRSIFRRHALRVPSMHTDLFTLQTRMAELSEAAHVLGATYVTLPSLPADLRTTLDDYKRAADVFNAIGKQATRYGVRFAYHNHGYGLAPVDGQIPLDTLLAATDPGHVFFELDTYWTIAGGADPKDLLARYKGRYKLMHLKDMQGEHRFAGDGGDPAQWIELFAHMRPLGSGSVDMMGIINAARTSGVDHFFVEQDRADDPMAAAEGSAKYLMKAGFR